MQRLPESCDIVTCISMATAVLSKILRKPSALRTIGLGVPSLSISPIPLLSPRNPHDRTNPDHKIPNPLLGFLDFERIPSSQPPLQIYPSFPYGLHLNPISPPGFAQPMEDEASDALTPVWADSVKKKRKRKMNKHKYKKLRKSLRRQT
ncbi:hypothetical protein MRB53_034918 [Persea americana]|uniref:Uncharacterized protein n=1 Tax=Persea americana TaxID=3435 RepID=A0ACC2K390_PERAE|nr:hypothetical protein MRB53_034918 [Persea americana]